MNKKGFTLIELLGVIIILGIIIAIAFPSVSNILNKGENVVNDIQINRILDAAYDFTLKNTDFLPEKDEIKYITLNQLKKENLVDSDIKDSNKKMFSDDLLISIKNKISQSKKDKHYKYNGDYLYTIELEFMNSSEYIDNKPIISFIGFETTPIVIDLNIGDDYIPLEYSAESINGIDLTDRVVENIIYNSKNRKKIDTKTAGIYYINYSVIDDNGYASLATVNVIVSDNEKPTIFIPSDETISKSKTSYDFLEGVRCEDNSGACEIKINGSINFGVSGKYIIEYIASDPSGNTAIKKRTITVE